MPAADTMDALDDLSATIGANASDERLLLKRIKALRAARLAEGSWRAALAHQGKPGVLQLTAQILSRLTSAGAQLRRSLAASLRDEGLTIPAIAQLFAVTHQRVSAVLRDNSDHPASS